ncbi:MAG: hypothetical protein L7H10_05735 [Vulcanisaeta sp.]|jgi:hypothetical protein|nr:hypothetical protein [Vulcanisaeta sp.]MCG2870235.1 hypothetical protein [Vulcanisaeta sp.]MCG2886899.1 hypothetical protein [Vulcanisaeta sp.]
MSSNERLNKGNNEELIEKAHDSVKRIIEPSPAIVRIHCYNCNFDSVKIPNGVEFRFRLLIPFMAAVIRYRQSLRDIFMLDSKPVITAIYQSRVKDRKAERPIVIIYGEINPTRRIWRVLGIYNLVLDDYKDSIVRPFNVITKNEVWHYHQSVSLNGKTQHIGIVIANKVLIRYLTRFGEDGASVKMVLLSPDGVQVRRLHVDSEEEVVAEEKSMIGE